MMNISIVNLQDNLADYIKSAVDFDDIITVSTENGILSNTSISCVVSALSLSIALTLDCEQR